MSSRRPPSEPPDLAGFTHQGLLGSGGFADVFLYEQEMPRRRVAVKVLLIERLTQGSANAFSAEANIMAQLAAHPAIVTIYQAGLAGDGRPYLVMEYCPRSNLQVRYRKERFSAAETLRVGVQIGGAVETAHRAGILHRDIKPANILITEYNRPALTDFGISVVQGGDGGAAGMSIPWSPPEVFADETAGGPQADVYSLGATLYTLLAGHSPFEIPGQRNTSADMIQRIESAKVPPLGRADVPEALTRVLERAMAKSPSDRYATALDLARALQRVQAEMNLSSTPIDVLDESVEESDEEEDDAGLTVIRRPVVIDPTAPARTSVVPPSALRVEASQDSAQTVDRGARDRVHGGGFPVFEGSEAPAETMRRPTAAPVFAEPEAPAPEPASEPADGGESSRPGHRRGRVALSIAAGIVVLGGAGVAWAATSGAFDSTGPEPSSEPTSAEPQDVLPTARVEDLEGTIVDGEAVFTWTNPDPQEGDIYLWKVQRLGEDGEPEIVTEPTVTVPAEETGPTCIEVVLRRANGTSATTGVEGCAS